MVPFDFRLAPFEVGTKTGFRHVWTMLESDQRWTEYLLCPRCRKTGVAHISARDSPFEDHADLVPKGFKVVPAGNGAIKFYCTTCHIPARA
jgi:hypothetical protein